MRRDVATPDVPHKFLFPVAFGLVLPYLELMTNTNKSQCDEAIDLAGSRAWILRSALEVSRTDANLTHVMRNVRCDAMRAALVAMPTDGEALKVPTARAAVLALMERVIMHLRAEGFVTLASVYS